jgi:hypothetical protein
MSNVHIFVASKQPATRWVDYNIDPPHTITWPANLLLWCRCCFKKRPAKNCVVQNYYDALYVWCAEGKGCKDPKVIATKRHKEFLNRSNAQRARWAKR